MRSCAAGAISRCQSDILSSKWFPQGLTGLRVRTRKGGGPLKVLIVILIVRLCVLCVPCGKTSRPPLSNHLTNSHQISVFITNYHQQSVVTMAPLPPSSEPNRSNPNQSEVKKGRCRSQTKAAHVLRFLRKLSGFTFVV